MDEDAHGQRCHACGDTFMYLAKHAWHTHDLTAAEYRSMFGLAWQQKLMAHSLRRRMADILEPWKADKGSRPPEVTPERRAMLSARPRRLQVSQRRYDKDVETIRRVRPERFRSPSEPNTRACSMCGDLFAAAPTSKNRTCGRPECRRGIRLGRTPGNAKVTRETAEKIRAALAGGRSQTDVAREYGVSQSNVSMIHRGLTFRVTT